MVPVTIDYNFNGDLEFGFPLNDNRLSFPLSYWLVVIGGL